MEDRPDAASLLDAVGALLTDDIVPALAGATAYHARVAAGVVALVARQLRGGAAADAAEAERLRDLLGGDGDLATLNAMLAARLRAGSLSIDEPAVADHLWRTTLAKLAIDQPRYPRYREVAGAADADDAADAAKE